MRKGGVVVRDVDSEVLQEVVVLRFLRNLFRRKDTVEYLREAWRTKPSIAVAEKLFHRLQDTGSPGAALAFIREAGRAYPHAQRLRDLQHQALRVRSSEEVKSLRAALAANPRPEIYARLGELYRYLGHCEEALEIAREGIARYPQSGGNYLAIGLVHYSRFLKTSSAHDGLQTEACLRQAYALDSASFKSLYYLACLYVYAGAKPMASECIARLAELMPGDNRVADLAQRAQALPDSPQGTAADYFRLHEARAMEAAAGAPGRAEPFAGLRPGKPLNDRLARIAALPGVDSVCVLDRYGARIAGAGRSGDTACNEAALQGMLEGARVNARRMSIGNFSRAVLRSKDWQVFLYELEPYGLAVMGGRTARQDLVQRKVTEFIEECLCEEQGA